MYLPSHFAEARPEVLAQLIHERPFGLLVTQGDDGALAADSIPFVLDADPAGGPGILRAHVARANKVWQRAAGREALVVFQGPQGYVSPAWYASKAEHGKVVPTWNYVTVQARGPLRAIEDSGWLHALVSRLTERHEAGRPAPWAVTDAPAPYIDSMLRAIVGIELVLSSLEGKWKLSQNRSAADREGVVRGLESVAETSAGAGDEARSLGHQVQAPGSGV